jgi:ABC-type Fe3+-hydroxamate transport system substrate-binding protein
MFPPPEILSVEVSTSCCKSVKRGGRSQDDPDVGAIVDPSERAQQLAGKLELVLATVRERTNRLPKRPRVFFEEWDDPLISGIGEVSELVEIAGGADILSDGAGRSLPGIAGWPSMRWSRESRI